MTNIFNLFSLDFIALICIASMVSGVIKGVVGFGMPMIFITFMTMYVDPALALGILILPTLTTNAWQACRQGTSAAIVSLYEHRWFLGITSVSLLITTQIVPLLSQTLFFICLGLFVIGLATLMLIGWRPWRRNNIGLSIFCALVAGVGGGLSGVWGPPTVVYLSKDSLKKEAQVRAQGVIYGLCSIFLFLGHVQSGIATAPVLALGLCAIIPAFFGQWIGFKIQESINQVLFSKITLCILLVAGLNLIRRGLL